MGNLLLNGALVYPAAFQEESIACVDQSKVGNPSNNGINPNPCGGLMCNNHTLLPQAIAIRLCQPCHSLFLSFKSHGKIGALVIPSCCFPILLASTRKGQSDLYSTNKTQMDEYHESHTSSTGTLNTLYSSLCVTKDTFPIEQSNITGVP